MILLPLVNDWDPQETLCLPAKYYFFTVEKIVFQLSDGVGFILRFESKESTME